MKVNVADWHKVNIWRHASGEMCVRPGLITMWAPETGRIMVGGFSVQNSYTPEVWHYVFDVDEDDNTDLRLRIYDETGQIFQTLAINANGIPRVITHAVIEGQILITSPDFPSLFGLVGSGVTFATTVDSDNEATTALPVPRGICSTWCNRVVVCDGRSMFVSDPITPTGGDVRTFVGQNQQQRPGIIFGVHEGRDNDLVVVTSAGVYAIGADATAGPVIGGAIWRLVNHHCASSYASSCAVRGRIYALTKEGYALVDTETNDEVKLSEPLMPRALFPRISLEDFRSARMYATDDGPIVAADAVSRLHVHDVTSGLQSWWYYGPDDDEFFVRGVLKDLDGTEMIMSHFGGALLLTGDYDGSISGYSAATTQATGSIFGTIPYNPEENRLVEHIDHAAAVGGASSVLGCALRGTRKSGALESDPNGYVVGTEVSGRRLTTTPLSSARFDWGPAACSRTDDVALELEAKGNGNRMGMMIAVHFAKSRRSDPDKVI